MATTRRDLLAVGVAGLAAPVFAKPAPALPRGLWRDETGAFALGSFPEFGSGQFGFDYETLRFTKIVTEGLRGWKRTGALDGSGDGLGLIAARNRILEWSNRRLTRLPVKRKPFDVRSEPVGISAELAVPAWVQPRGTILMIYGSGPAPKEAFDPWSFWFLAQGLSVITYDKRGSGRSGGDWRLTGLEDLARDAQNVLARAREIGIAGPLFTWGASQAGWIQPQLAAKGLVDGIIMHAGATTTPAEQIVESVEAELRGYAFADDEIARAKAYYALDIDVSRGARPWSDINTAFKQESARGAEWLLGAPAAAGAPERTMIRLMADFDPAPFWHDCKVPVLALFGEKDWIVPAKSNRTALETNIFSRDFLTSVTLPAANHLMFSAQTGVRAEYPSRSQIVPGYFPAIYAWLDRQI